MVTELVTVEMELTVEEWVEFTDNVKNRDIVVWLKPTQIIKQLSSN